MGHRLIRKFITESEFPLVYWTERLARRRAEAMNAELRGRLNQAAIITRHGDKAERTLQRFWEYAQRKAQGAARAERKLGRGDHAQGPERS